MRRALPIALVLAACEPNLTPPGDRDGGPAVFECLPDLDGVLHARELPLAFDLPVDYLVSPEGTPIDLAGAVDEAGRRVWDYAAESAADQRLATRAVRLRSQWYALDFPGAELVVPALGATELDGVYSLDEAGFWLHGLASPEENPPTGHTLLVYDEPVALLRFPLAPGDRWIETAAVSGGTLDGLPYNGTDTYEIEDDALGRVELPFVSFTQAHRVRTHVTVAPAAGGVTSSRHQTSFFFECFGEVARATSRAGEPSANFTIAAEVRRLSL
ncbi:MAG TPA: hypothetical protein VML75_07245 [Kofleriaceae bacterium]|nr:hypothetical protein [Kofleriaceae bacterium]